MVSVTTCPSNRLMMRDANPASCWLCVTMTIVVPSLFSSFSKFITSCPFLLSRLPVGSSARISFGLATTARAMATRCCWPPDNCCGKCFSRCTIAIRSIASCTFFSVRQPKHPYKAEEVLYFRTRSIRRSD